MWSVMLLCTIPEIENLGLHWHWSGTAVGKNSKQGWNRLITCKYNDTWYRRILHAAFKREVTIVQIVPSYEGTAGRFFVDFIGAHVRRRSPLMWKTLKFFAVLTFRKKSDTEIKGWPRWNSNRVPPDPKSQNFQLSHKALDKFRWLKRLFVFGFFFFVYGFFFFFGFFILYFVCFGKILSQLEAASSVLPRIETFARCPRVVPSAAPRALRSDNALRFLCSVEPRTQLLILT